MHAYNLTTLGGHFASAGLEEPGIASSTIVTDTDCSRAPGTDGKPTWVYEAIYYRRTIRTLKDRGV